MNQTVFLTQTPLDIVDAQVHLGRGFGAAQVLHSMEALGITSVVIDEYWGYDAKRGALPGDMLPDGSTRPLNPMAQAMAFADPERVAILQRINRQDPLLREVMALLGASEATRAVRIVLLDDQERDAFSAGAYDEVLRLAVKYDLAVCLLDPHPEVLPNVFDRFPELRLVLDHCGYVHDAEQWDKVLRAASLPRLSMKWSHTARAIANIASREDQATAKSREFLRALDAYGVERIMWASDVTTQKESWHDLLGFVSHHPTLSQGDKEWVLGRTAREVFQWPRPVAANS